MKDKLKTKNRLLRQVLSLTLSFMMVFTMMPTMLFTTVANAAVGDTPPHTKNLTDNHDGTYTLSLDVVGESEKKPNNVNVTVILDVSGSMDDRVSYWSSQTRMDAAQSAINGLANSLYAYNTQSAPNTVEMALVTFSNTATIAQTPTNDQATFRSAVNRATPDGGTNWEGALQTANTVNYGDNDQTFVIFVSDGNPTFRFTEGNYSNHNNDYNRTYHERYGVWGSGSENDTTTVARCYEHAVDDAQTLARKVGVKNFYTIGAFGNVTRMQNLTTAAGAPSANYYSASDAAALNAAIAEILASIEMSGIGNASIEDGTTNQVTTSSGTIAELLEVDTSSFKYYRSGGTYGNMQEWADAPAAEFKNGAVDWNLAEEGVLENGVKYTVTFDCYPSQYTYDTIAKLKNGDITYDSLDSEVKKYIVDNGNGTYSLRTNTNATLSYNDTRNDAGQQTAGYTNPSPVRTDSATMSVKKDWENELDGRAVGSIDMTVLMDGATFHDVTLSADDTPAWTQDSIFISPGIIKNGQVLSGAEGHDFTFAELGTEQYNWELVAPTVHPMLINGTLTMLTMVDANHQAPSGAQTYTINGKTYYSNGSSSASLDAFNYRRSNLNLTKAVTGDDAPDNATFPFTLTVNNSKASSGSASDLRSDYYVWFSIYDTKAGATVKDATIAGATPEEGDTGYYYAPSGSAITVQMKDGWNLRFTNLPAGTRYTFAEGTLDDGFVFNKSELSGGTDSTFSGAKTTTGTVENTNSSYTVTYTNQYNYVDVTPQVTKKVTGRDATEKFEFSLEPADDATTAAINNEDIVFPDSAKNAETKADIKAGGEETVSFGKITFKKAGTYKFTVDETTALAPSGWTYDASTHDITVTVAADNTGKLTATMSGDNPTFTNSYSAEPTTAQIPVVKNVVPNDTALDITGKFTFTLAAGSNTAGEGVATPMPEDNSIVCGASGAEVKFGQMTFTKAGTYTYTVTESVTPGKSAGGISLDNDRPRTFTVVVTDDGEGKLHASVNGDNAITFNNPYNVTSLDVTIPVTKILTIPAGLTGPGSIQGKYTFTLAAADNEAGVGTSPLPTKSTELTNPAANGGTAVFGEEATTGKITFTKPGTYHYTVTETGSVPGVTNDAEATKSFTVVVKDNGDGTMTATVNGGEDIKFNNDYNVKPVSAQIPVQKDLKVQDGKTAPPIKEAFTFSLKNEAGETLSTVKNPDNDGGLAWFASQTYSAPGTYTYEITEEGSVPGIINDSSDKSATVVVADDGKGQLVIQSISSTEEKPVTFVNNYHEATINIPVEKILEKDETLTGPDITGRYTFTITAPDGTPMPAVTEITNNGGAMAFGPITYKTEGEYTYTITETGTVDGVTNDASKVVKVKVSFTEVTEEQNRTIVVESEEAEAAPEAEEAAEAEQSADAAEAEEQADGVADAADATEETAEEGAAEEAEAQPEKQEEAEPVKETKESEPEKRVITEEVTEKVLKAELVDGKGATFNNTYEVKPTTVEFPVKKILDVTGEGPDDITGEYTFTLTAVDGAPLTDADGNTIVTEKTNPDKDGGTVTFGTIQYTKAGTYTYEVTETGDVPGVTNDATPTKTVTVTVKDNKDGTLTATASSTDKAPLTFTNTYTYSSTEAVLQVRKILNVIPEDSRDVPDITGKYTFKLIPGDHTYLDGTEGKSPMPASDSVTNPAADGGLVAFDKITFTEPGDYLYTITESGKVKGVVNDRDAQTGKTVTVKVRDNKTGGLSVDVDYGNGKAQAEFTNTFETKDIDLGKIWEDNSDQDGKRPETITVNIMNGADVVRIVVVGVLENMEVGEGQEYVQATPDESGNNWSFTVQDLIRFTEDGSEITYSIVEDAVAEYTTTYNGYTITNEHKPETIDVSAKKIWDDNSDADGVRPDSITFQLYKTVGGKTSAVDGKTVELSGDTDTWTGTIKDLPKYEGKKVIEYSFKELDDEGNPVEDGGVLKIGDSRWIATYAGADEEAATTVTNKLSRTSIKLGASKTLVVEEGLNAPDVTEKYDLVIKEGETKLDSAKNPDGKGTAVYFADIEYTKVGVYTYTISENGTVAGVTNDANAGGKTVKVTVTANANGSLKAEITGGKEVTNFENTYGVESTSITLGASKTLEVESGDNPPDVSGKYTFTLADKAGETVDKKTNPDGKGTAVDFDAITYTAPGTYEYTVTESGNVDGVTNGTTSYKVTVTVTDNGDGTLTAKVTEGDKITAFTNTYSVEPTTASFPVEKILDVPEGLKGPKDWSYDITVTANNGAPEAETMEGKVTKAEPSVTFGPIEYTAPGTYTYTVSESGDIEGVTNDKDAAGKTVRVKVVDNGNGTLTATADSTTEKPLTFTNTYSVKETKASFPVKKEMVVPPGLEGPKDWSYDITVTANNGAPEAETMEGKVTKAEPSVTFGDFTYTKPGTYTYTVTESGQIAGVTNDTEAAKTVTVTVVDNGNGTLTATADYTDKNPVKFTNTYSVKSTTAKFPVTKELVVPEGLKGPEKWSYTIDVAANGNAPKADVMTGTVNQDTKTVTFGDFTYTMPGTYTYTVTETGEIAGVANDEAAESGKTVTVTVVDNHDGTLTATADSTTDKPLTFTNTYSVKETTAEFPVEKVLTVPEGQEGPLDWTYKIDVAANDGAPVAAEMSGEVTKAKPSVTFGKFKYTEPGTYTYTVTETGEIAGVTNDEAAKKGKTVTVTVVDNGNGTLTATPSSTTESPLKFTNAYSVGGTSVNFPVKKEMVVPEGLAGPESWSYDVTVEAKDGAPEAETMTGKVTNTSNTLDFGPFKYTEPGTYTYEVTESGKIAGVDNDAETTKIVTVTVVDNHDGTMTATASSTEEKPLTFTNTYSVKETTAEFPVEKEMVVPDKLDGPEDWSYDITVEAQGGAPEAETMDGKVTKAKPSVTFGKFTYTEPGTYTYNVTESGKIAGVDNDAEATKTVTVTVVDNHDGTMTATASSTTDKPLTFTNTYSVKETTAKFPVEKEMVIPDKLDGPVDWSYDITVEAQDGAPSAEAMAGKVTKAEPSVTFGNFTYTVPGTYTYNVTESGKIAGVDNDAEATKTVTVTVVDNHDGTMTATADSTTDKPLTFTNTYSVKETTAEFPVEKEMVVPTGLAGPLDWSYDVAVKAQDGAPAAETMDGKLTKAEPSVTFGEFTYTVPGTYTYEVTESGKIAGVTNDAEETKTVTVTVVDNHDGTMTATADSTTDKPLTFTNTYSVKETTAKFPVNKEMVVPEVLDGPVDWSYDITVEAQDGAPAAETMAGQVTKAEPSVTFGDFTYTMPGTYTYNVTETGEIAGVTNDAEATKTVTVTVVDNHDGTMTATADSTTDEPLTFTNTYSADPVNVTEFLHKNVESMMPGAESAEFEFTLEGPKEAETSETLTATVTATEAGVYDIDFGGLTFTEPGEYSYTLTEITDGLDGGWIVEDNPAEFTITVTDNHEGKLVAEVEDYTITNKFDTVDVNGEKTWNDTEFLDKEGYSRPESIKVTLYAETLGEDGSYETVRTYEKTVTAGEDGKWTYSWNDLPKYNFGKEIRYTVKEDVPDEYTYETVDDTNLVNTPKDKVDVIDPVSLIIQKTDRVTGGALAGALFEVKNSDGQVVTSATTNEEGYAEIEFTAEGTYTMTETAPEGYFSDPGTWTIVVTQSGVDSVKYDDPNEGVWNWFYHLFFGEGTDYEEGTLNVSNPPTLTEVTPEKIWNDNNDKDGVRPDSVTYGLYKTVGDADPVAVVDSEGSNVTVTLSKPAGNTVSRWTGETLEDLPAYENGKPVTYSFRELNGTTALEDGDVLPGKPDADGNAAEYTVSYSADYLTVTNSHQSEPQKEAFEGTSTTVIDGEVVEPGQTLTYQITYTNTTGETAELVTITDRLPEYTTFQSATEGGTEADGVVTWTFEDVADGDTKVVQAVVTVNDDVSGEILENTAVINDGKNDYESNEVTNPTPPEKEVWTGGVTTNIDGETVTPGQELTYAIKYTNSKDEEISVNIVDTLPEYCEFVSADNGGTEANGTVTWSDITIAAGESVTVTATVRVKDDVSGEALTNEAIVHNGENEYTSNEVTNPTPPQKTVYTGGTEVNIDGEAVKPGQELQYNIKYSNTKAEDVVIDITDAVPEYTTFVSADNGGTFNEGTVTWTGITVPANDSVTVSFTVTVNEDVSGQDLTNTATVVSGDNEYQTNEVVNPTPRKLVIEKTLPDFVDHEAQLDEGAYNYATFAFEITGTYTDANGETQNYRNTIGMDFSRASDLTQSVTVEGIPGNIENLAVEEIYSGNYAADEVRPTITLNEETGVYEVSFRNTKDNTEYGGGVVNHYDREGFNGTGETASGVEQN